MRYDESYRILADRAVRQGLIDIETMIARLVAGGSTMDRIESQLIADLEEGGPVFGKLFRSLEGALTSSVSAAERQGASLGHLMSMSDKEFSALQDRMDASIASKLEDIDRGQTWLDEPSSDVAADPDVLEQAEFSMLDVPHGWIAELKNTCYRCLPLHGKVKTLREWNELGLHPDTIHEGWDSQCHCSLIPGITEEGITSELSPLVRVKSATSGRGSKSTIRAITSADVARGQRAVEQAQKSAEGMRLLKMLGTANS